MNSTSTAVTGTADEIAEADGNADKATPAQKAAADAADQKKKKKRRVKRSSRVEQRSAAAVSYRHGIKFRA
jgi:hypothetical protein